MKFRKAGYTGRSEACSTWESAWDEVEDLLFVSEGNIGQSKSKSPRGRNKVTLMTEVG